MLIDNTEKIVRNIEQTASKDIAKIDAQLAVDVAEQKKLWAAKEKAANDALKLYVADQKERFMQHHTSKVAIETQKRELTAKKVVYQEVLAEVRLVIQKNATPFIKTCLKQLPKKYVELQVPVWAIYKDAKSILPEDSFAVIVKISDSQEFEYSLETMLEVNTAKILNLLFKKKE
jgi:hypothetical protein